jgi:alanyl-tRNA synthetase
VTPAEDWANKIIYEDRPIKSYFISDDQIRAIPFRRPPKVKGQIRVVEIDSFDYSACGGTHCTRTGMIGIVKVLKTVRRAEKLRVFFAAGQRAFECFQDYHAIVTQIARQFDASPDAIVEMAARQQESLRAAQKELEELRSEKLLRQVKQLVANAESFDAIKLVTASLCDRSPQELRALAMLLQNEPVVIALLAVYEGVRLSLTISCGSNTGVSANELLRKQLAEINGRGGGDAQLAQGGGAIDEKRFESFFAHTREYIRALRR